MELNPYESPVVESKDGKPPTPRRPSFSLPGTFAGVILGSVVGVWIAPADNWLIAVVGAAFLGGLAGSVFRSL